MHIFSVWNEIAWLLSLLIEIREQVLKEMLKIIIKLQYYQDNIKLIDFIIYTLCLYSLYDFLLILKYANDNHGVHKIYLNTSSR